MRFILICCVMIALSMSAVQGQRRDQPFLESFDCPTPQNNQECGYLHVPEDRTQRNSSMIRLYVQIWRASGSDTQPDPIVFLNGGPGIRTIELQNQLYGFNVLNLTRDVIFFDQRGIGLSEPALDCLNFGTAFERLLLIDLFTAERIKQLYDAHDDCQRRLTNQGISLSAYNTVQNAADVEDLRIVLGYEEWNLYGGSYGTLLGFTVLRDYPEHVRSAVFMSVVPPQVNWMTERAANAERAFSLFFQTCEENITCQRDYPNLQTDFYQLVAQLNATPVRFDLNPSFSALIRGDSYLELLFSALYDSAFLSFMPSVIDRALNGDHQTIAIYLVNQQFQNSVLSAGMYHSVVCADTIRDLDYATLAAPDDRFPQFNNAFDAGHWRDLCTIWQITPSDPVYQTPVVSDVPVLLLSGRFDPITPPSYGDLALETLSNGYHYVLPYTGHALQADRCARLIARAFLNEPTVEPDTECIGLQPQLRFRELPQ